MSKARKPAVQPPAPKPKWRNRIVGHATLHPKDVCPSDRNWRKHPKIQMDALEGAIDKIGIIRSVLVCKRSGVLIDGHARLKLALETGQTEIQVEYVDLDEQEELYALATHDTLAMFAETDQGAIDSLVADLSIEDARVQDMLDTFTTAKEEAAIDESPEDLPEELKLEKPPDIVWVLIGIPLSEYGAVRDKVLELREAGVVSVQTNRDED